MMRSKFLKAKIKAAGQDDNLDEGTIIAYASVFGNVDSYGDVIEKGAFARTLAEWEDSGDRIPLLWGHQMNDPMAHIGYITDAVEDDKGLRINAKFDFEDNPTAKQVYKLCKGRRVRDLSFAFDIKEHRWDEDHRIISDLDLYECSIVTVGANPETEIVAVKNRIIESVKSATDIPSEKLEDLRDELVEAVAAIDAVLAPASEETAKAGESSPESEIADKAAPPTPAPSIAEFALLKLAELAM